MTWRSEAPNPKCKGKFLPVANLETRGDMSKGTDYHNLKVELRTLPPPEGVYKCASVYKSIKSRGSCITSVYISVYNLCISNRAEFIVGTDPNNPDSALRITRVEPQAGGVLLNWQAGTNVTCYLKCQKIRATRLASNSLRQITGEGFCE